SSAWGSPRSATAAPRRRSGAPRGEPHADSRVLTAYSRLDARRGGTMATSAADGFRLEPGDLKPVGKGLKRPECVLCMEAGHIFVSHKEGGVTQISPDGRQRDILGDGEPTVLTNGFAITQEGDFLLANLVPPGGVWRLTREG